MARRLAAVRRDATIPLIATLAAVGYLAACVHPVFLAAAVAASEVAACALVLTLRPTRALRWLLVGIAAWLVVGLVGVWLLRTETFAGLLWVVATMFALPIPLIPWAYASTFATTTGEAQAARPAPRAGEGSGRATSSSGHRA
jgi:hypothetical protein